MERDTVLILGAGASFGARPTNPRPPLGAQLAHYLLTWFDANAPEEGDYEWSAAMENELDPSAPPDRLYDGRPEVRSTLVRAVERSRESATGFEEIMEALLREETRRVLGRINEVIAIAFLGGRACAFGPQRDGYDTLFSLLAPRLRSIVTPNYDLLAEEALRRVGLSCAYGGTQTGGNEAVLLYKFHGSANWFQPLGVGRGASLEAAQRSAAPLRVLPQTRVLSHYNDLPLYAPEDRGNAFLEHKHEPHMDPVLVTYGPGKDAVVGRPYLDSVRQICARELAERPPARVIALGISPPRGGGDDDAWEQLCKLLASCRARKEYWSGNQGERDAMALYGFEGRRGWFDECVCAARS